jgi:RNA-splicing ligase RtcB
MEHMAPTRIDNVLVWGSDMEDATIAQAAQAARMPFVAGHLALMPDAHVGKGATIGSVIPTQGAIIPAAVGVDIGCGMTAVETDLVAGGLPDDIDKLHSWIAKVVPAGLGQGHTTARDIAVPDHFSQKEAATAAKQFGSLGSGNHFVEVCLDERDRVWVVLHSGSRGIGNQLAAKHIDGAKKLMKRYFIQLEDPDLAYLVQSTPEFDAYIADMLWAQEYALGNRSAMMDEILTQLWGFVGVDREHGVGREVRRINCHHNFTQMENHHGRNVWLTRKGAIKAGVGDEGIIPGSMGTSSYIVRGKGNPASYESCSHGAGRRLSRSTARKTLTVESLRDAMKGTAWNGMPGHAWSEADAKTLLDEHPDAYKDIDQVMADQADLVEVEHTLRQILNYKGC